MVRASDILVPHWVLRCQYSVASVEVPLSQSKPQYVEDLKEYGVLEGSSEFYGRIALIHSGQRSTFYLNENQCQPSGSAYCRGASHAVSP